MKKCICCGMPMNKKNDFAMGDESKDYCVYCAGIVRTKVRMRERIFIKKGLPTAAWLLR